jgi:hypothetical protein
MLWHSEALSIRGGAVKDLLLSLIVVVPLIVVILALLLWIHSW